jgi:hypothetical protein
MLTKWTAGGSAGASRASKVVCLGSAALFASLISLNGAGAATLSLVGGASSSLTSSYNPNGAAVAGIGNGTAIKTFTSFGAGQGLLVSPENVFLTFDYIGKEASFTNEFKLVFGSAIVFDTQTSSTGSTSGPILFDVLANPGAVPFYFQSVTNGNKTATNGGSVASGLGIAFACATTNVCYAFFDDGGAGPDKDWDDMVIRITATDIPTPLPAALPLFVGGLAALGLVARRRNKKASVSHA